MTAAAVRVFWLSVTAAPVLLPLLLLRRRLLDRRRIRHCYLLWLILCLRLILPLELPVSHPPVMVTLPNAVSVLSAPVSGVLTTDGRLNTPPDAAAPTITALDCFSLLWMTGAVLSLCLQTGGYCLARRRLMTDAQPDSHSQTLAAELGGTVPVLRCAVTTPLTMGLLHPVILLPHHTGEDDLEMILRHELCHIRRRDLWYKGLFLLCTCVHWFNPLVWLLARTAGETVELYCDEDVVAGQDMQFKHRYGQCLLRAAADHSGAVLFTSFGSSDMKGRLMNLFAPKKKGGLLLCALCGAAVCMGSLVGCQVSAKPAPSDIPAEAPIQQIQAPQSIIPAQPALPDPPSELPVQEDPQPNTVWPVEKHYILSAVYGDRHHPITGENHSHSGVDIPAEPGTLVLAALDGTVTDCRFDDTLGNCVELTHEDGCTSLYGCLQDFCVTVGDCVTAGQVIGTVGATGQATGHHLHYEVRNQQGHHTDPLCSYPKQKFSHHT